jgi:hypothetical protein
MKNKKPMTVADAGSIGGTARAKKLSPERRKEIATKASHSRSNYAMPPKLHTLKVPCPKEGCKVTVGHEHINN